MKIRLIATYLALGLGIHQAGAANTIPLIDFGGRPGFHINGVETDDWTGLPVEGIGDFNGDGLNDFLVGSEHGSPGGGGATYLIFGRTTGFPTLFDLSSLNGSNGMRIESGLTGGNEFDASAAGDFNNDGFADLLMGTPDYGSGTIRGRACVVFGGLNQPAVLSLLAINGSNGTCYLGVSDFDNMGKAVASIGDINNDGIDDVAMGSALVNAQAIDDGAICVIFGRSGSFPASISLASINGANGFTFSGRNADDGLGISVAAAGDVNGDGISDMVIGSEDEDGRRGAAYVLFGKSSPWNALMSPADINGTNGFRLLGARAIDSLGRGTGSLDFDGDGFSDVSVGTTFGGLGNQNGSAYVLYGHPGPFPAETDVGLLDGTNGRSFYGSTSFQRLGEQATSAGDVNGDGIEDLMLSAPFSDYNGLTDSGSMYIVFGSSQRGPSQMLSSDIHGRVGFRMDGFDADGYCGQRQRRVGDINGDGLGDIVVGCNYSAGGGVHRGSAHVLFGNTAPLVNAPASTLAFVELGSGARTFALAAIAAAQYLDAQPFAGAALTDTPSSAFGTWAYRQSAALSFAPVPSGLSTANALVLSASAELQFTPSTQFVGLAAIDVRFWDGTGAYSPGLRNIDGDIGVLGGFSSDANVHRASVFVGAIFADGFE